MSVAPHRVMPSPVMVPLTYPSHTPKEHMLVNSWRDAPPKVSPSLGSRISPNLVPACVLPRDTLPRVSPSLGSKVSPSLAPACVLPPSAGLLPPPVGVETAAKEKPKPARRKKKSVKGLRGAAGVGGDAKTEGVRYAVRVFAVDTAAISDRIKTTAMSLTIPVLESFVLPATYALKIKRTDTDRTPLSTPMGSELLSPEPMMSFDSDHPDGESGEMQTGSFASLPPPAMTDSLCECDAVQMVVASVTTEAEAMLLAEKLRSTGLTVELYVRAPDEMRSPTLVLKGIPFAVRGDKLLEELRLFPWAPSYVRFHFSDRGMFKGIAYVKYRNRDDAERARMVLERLQIGTKRLKVEYRRPAAAAGSSTAYPALCSSKSKEEPSPASKDAQITLEAQLVALTTSKEHAGLSYVRSSLTREESKFVKTVCERLGHEMEVTSDYIRIMRDPSTLPQPSQPEERTRTRNSPALYPRTPPVVPQLPEGMEFRGVEHWKGVGAAHAQKLLPCVLCRSPATEPGASFPAGRGKPIHILPC